MKTETGGKAEKAQQQSHTVELHTHYRTLGIPALNAATLFKRRACESNRQRSAVIQDFKD